MSTSLAADQPLLASQADLVQSESNDPFLAVSTSSNHHRFSHFDNQLFALGPTTSPDQAKRALEAHLAETEKRIQEASKLGTTLVQQRKDLAERLKDVEKQQSEGDITPELRQKLVEIEKEYNEVGRESARAFLPKSRVSSSELGGSPFAGDAKVARVFNNSLYFLLMYYSVPSAHPSSKAKPPIRLPNSVSPIGGNEISRRIAYMTSSLQQRSVHRFSPKFELSRPCSLKRKRR